MCLNRQVDLIRITLQRRNLHRIENGLVRFSVNRVLVSIQFIMGSWSSLSRIVID